MQQQKKQPQPTPLPTLQQRIQIISKAPQLSPETNCIPQQRKNLTIDVLFTQSTYAMAVSLEPIKQSIKASMLANFELEGKSLFPRIAALF